MQSAKKILCVRHAESEYNLAQREATNSEQEVTLEMESLDVKYNPSLIDCGLSDYGILQCLEKQKEFQQLDINYILVSPLKRAIQTAHYLFKDHPNNPKFIILPELCEMLMSSCDVGGKLSDHIQEFDYMDFSRLTQNEIICKTPNLWSLEYCEDRVNAKIALEYVKKRIEETKTHPNESAKFLVEFMKQTCPRYLETFSHTRQRIEKLKTILQNELQKLPENSKVACVSHSRSLNTLSASEFDEIGLPLNGIWWHNCQAIELEL